MRGQFSRDVHVWGARAALLGCCCGLFACGAPASAPQPHAQSARGNADAPADPQPASAATLGRAAPAVGALVVIAEEADLLSRPDARALRFAVPLNRATDLTSGHVVEVVAVQGELVGVKTHDGALARHPDGP